MIVESIDIIIKNLLYNRELWIILYGQSNK